MWVFFISIDLESLCINPVVQDTRQGINVRTDYAQARNLGQLILPGQETQTYFENLNAKTTLNQNGSKLPFNEKLFRHETSDKSYVTGKTPLFADTQARNPSFFIDARRESESCSQSVLHLNMANFFKRISDVPLFGARVFDVLIFESEYLISNIWPLI